MLVSVVDPSAHVRKEFLNFVCHTTDGRVLTGLVVANEKGTDLIDFLKDQIDYTREKKSINN